MKGNFLDGSPVESNFELSESQRVSKMTSDSDVREKLAQVPFQTAFTFRDLVQEDWRDLVSAFFFPKQKKAIQDRKIRDFIARTNQELTEEGQEIHVISLLVTKAVRFFENNIDVLESLLQQLKDE